MQTLELFDGSLSGEFDLPCSLFISPSSSQHSQPSDSPSSVEGNNCHTMVIGPGGPALARDYVYEGSGVRYEMNEGFHGQQVPNADGPPDSCVELNVVGTEHDIVTFFGT